MSSEGASALGARLVEMDRLLRDVQAELVPEREPAPVLSAEPPPAASGADPAPSPPAAAPEPKTETLTVLSARLLASTRELLAGYEQLLVGRSAPQPSRRAVRALPEAPDVTLSAAPFANLDALREFEHAISGLPGVRDVVIRGYEGADRAIIEVRLDQRNP